MLTNVDMKISTCNVSTTTLKGWVDAWSLSVAMCLQPDAIRPG
jgi:hypothetical protein